MIKQVSDVNCTNAALQVWSLFALSHQHARLSHGFFATKAELDHWKNEATKEKECNLQLQTQMQVLQSQYPAYHQWRSAMSNSLKQLVQQFDADPFQVISTASTDSEVIMSLNPTFSETFVEMSTNPSTFCPQFGVTSLQEMDLQSSGSSNPPTSEMLFTAMTCLARVGDSLGSQIQQGTLFIYIVHIIYFFRR